jgi:uncharacterized membrane-anchored protein
MIVAAAAGDNDAARRGAPTGQNLIEQHRALL